MRKIKFLSHLKLSLPAGMVAAVALCLAGNISAATFVVTNTNDSGAGSLRQAVLDSHTNNVSDVINFDPAFFNVPRTITLTTGELVLPVEDPEGPVTYLTINGPGATLLTISGNNQSRIFAVQWKRRLQLDGLTLTGGNGAGIGTGFANKGGAILVETCSYEPNLPCLTIKNSVITGNRAADGGGVFIPGEGLIQNSAIINNTAAQFGGGIHSTHSRISNSTITGNTAANGGGIYIGYFGFIYLVHATVTGNTASTSGGIGTDSYYMAQGHATAINSIISGNQSSLVNGDSQNVSFFQSRNSIFNVPYSSTPSNGNQLNVNPKLGEMRTNAYGIPYFTLKADSPAVDKGDNCVLTPMANGGCEAPGFVPADIRGVTRPQDGDGNGTATVDIGAFEISAAEIALTPGKPDLATADDTGVSSTDNVTRARDLHIQLGNLTAGAIVKIYRNGVVIQTFTAAGASTEITDANLPADGMFSYYATQTIGGVEGISGASLDVTVDNTRPGSTLYQPGFQPDPTRDIPVRFVIGFTENIYGLTNSDISLASSTAGVGSAAVSVISAYPQYIIWVSGVTSDGQIIATMGENTVTDAAGNPNTASTYMDNSITYDRTYPAVTINQAAGQADPATGSLVNFTVTFSEPVTGFHPSHILLTGSTADVSAATVNITGVGPVYNVAVGNIRSSGTVRASIPNGRVVDQVGQSNSASTSTDNVVTYIFMPRRAQFDYDGDGRTDVSVFRPSTGEWHLLQSQAGYAVQGFGIAGDVLTPGDYDGDGKTDLAVFRPSTGTWWYKSTVNGGHYAVQWGASGDIPLAQDFNGDGQSDFVYYRPANSTWYRLGSNGQYSALAFGTAGDIPLVADFDGDGKADLAIYRPANGMWFVLRSAQGMYDVNFGTTGDKPTPAAFVP